LIRSLREELAGARDAERDRIADWLSDKSLATDAMTLKGGDTQANARLRAIAWQQAKDAVQIRNNEHELVCYGAMERGRDAERDRIADRLELRASKLEDELAISETSTEIGLERILAVIKSLRKEAIALRNNEHRSDT
jgi:hypothetical protein